MPAATLASTCGRGAPASPTRPVAAREAADVALLTGPAGGDLLAAVLAAEGVALDAWAVHQVHHRPGVGVTVGWTVTWRATSGGRTATGTDYLLATTAPVPAARPGVTTAVLGGRPVVVWRHPADPVLPGLERACTPVRVGAALGATRGTPEDQPPPALELVTYRPLRRAVLRARTADGLRYLKVLRPHVTADLLARHAMLRDAGLPVAAAVPLGDGVVALDALDGRPLAELLAAGEPVSPRVVTDLPARLPAAALGLPRRPSPAERVADHVAAATAVLPDHADDLARLGAGITRLVARADAGPLVPTHGDLNPANLLLADGALVGLLDVDTLGPGRLADDLAGLLGHLSVLPALAPQTDPHVPGVVAEWNRAFDEHADPVALRARAAAVVLSLVPGAAIEATAGADAVRAQALARVAVARRWLADARARARSLRDLSSRGPRRLIGGAEARGHQDDSGTRPRRRTDEPGGRE